MKRGLLFPVLLLSGFVLSGCSGLPSFPGVSGRLANPEADAKQLKEITDIELTRLNGKPEEALAMAQKYVKEKPGSPYLQAARLEEGQSLEDLEQPQAADAIYRSVRDVSMSKEPSIAARAEWRLSFTAESSGDDLRALTHVLSAEKQVQYLPEQISRAELPARKALLLHRLGREEEAAVSVRNADRGLSVLMSGLRPKPDDSWLARLYVQMGRSLATHVSEENFSAYLQGQRLSQRYLLKAIDQNDPIWSERGFQILRGNYADLWHFLSNPVDPAGVNATMALRQKREKQIPLLSQFLQLIDEAQALRPPGKVPMNKWQKDFFGMTNELAEKARQVLYSNSETMVLTEESRLLNGLRRAGRIRPVTPVQPVESKDPNLQ